MADQAQLKSNKTRKRCRSPGAKHTIHKPKKYRGRQKDGTDQISDKINVNLVEETNEEGSEQLGSPYGGNCIDKKDLVPNDNLDQQKQKEQIHYQRRKVNDSCDGSKSNQQILKEEKAGCELNSSQSYGITLYHIGNSVCVNCCPKTNTASFPEVTVVNGSNILSKQFKQLQSILDNKSLIFSAILHIQLMQSPVNKILVTLKITSRNEEMVAQEETYHDGIEHLHELVVCCNMLFKELLVQTCRGDRPPKTDHCFSSLKKSENLKSFASSDDGTNFNERAFGLATSGYYTESRADYSNASFKSKIVAGSSRNVNLAGVESEADNKPQMHAVSRLQNVDDTPVNVLPKQNNNHVPEHLLPSEQLYDNSQWLTPHVEKETQKDSAKTVKNTSGGYSKATYVVYIGNAVKVYLTQLFACLPRHNAFLVKERVKGTNRVKLVMKTTTTDAER